MAPPSSASLLPLFVAVLVITVRPIHGGGPRKSGKGQGQGVKKGGPPNPGTKGGPSLKGGPAVPLPGNNIETQFRGSWAIDNHNVGVAAMQFQLMPNNKAVWFDTTSLGPSARELGPPGNCPKSPEMNFKPDCFAHAIAYDVETGHSRTIYLDGEPWCSSGHLWPNGDLVATGGTRGGVRSVRVLSMTNPNANFVEKKNILADKRWYSSNQVLEDGSAVVVGGRNSFSYEIVPPNKQEFHPRRFSLPFLQETTVPKRPGPGMYIENNLYPFLFLIPDGNVFLFANDRGIIFHPHTGTVVRQFPKIPGGARNYPASGMAALLPLTITPGDIHAEVVVCGGNSQDAYPSVDSKHTKNRVFTPALRDCHRIAVTNHASTWVKEQDMPSGRCMGDLVHLANGDLLMINGARKGVAGWENAMDPNLTPVTLFYPPFTTHGFSMNQRLLILPVKTVVNDLVTAVAPPSGKVAPPGYYILFVNFRGIPGKGIWVHVD
ncbi:hypothetical protein L1987_54021 [Smallanthus sonchifolius]|uniref:Uncharacterized protein n=1 Tax=Smallanthus sonchifolius TaxID=185202 RepID=A0ACB9E6Y4_9ASTR|nr:hypothetical protein L1987_54021 [Smallanthus sonchifolius]